MHHSIQKATFFSQNILILLPTAFLFSCRPSEKKEAVQHDRIYNKGLTPILTLVKTMNLHIVARDSMVSNADSTDMTYSFVAVDQTKEHEDGSKCEELVCYKTQVKYLDTVGIKCQILRSIGAYGVSSYGLGKVDYNYISRNHRADKIKKHIRSFLANMFSFNRENYKQHIEKGLFLIGDEGEEMVKNYDAIGVCDHLVKQDMRVEAIVDSIWTEAGRRPYRARVFSRQNFAVPNANEQFWLWADMKLRDVRPTTENKGGFIIEDFYVVKKGKVEQKPI